jgi:hypothetical protein
MLVFYVLLRPVNRNLAMLAILFNLVQTGVLVANKLNFGVAAVPPRRRAVPQGIHSRTDSGAPVCRDQGVN